MKHADVPLALDLVVEEVGKESQRIRDAGSVALKAGKLTPAKKAIAYAEKLQTFVRKVRDLGDEWAKLQAEIDAAAPEVRDIVRPPEKTPKQPKPKEKKPRKTGFKRNVGHIAPKKNFVVTLSNGTVIKDAKAAAVLAKTIEALGAEKVAQLGFLVCGEPLVTKVKEEHVKYAFATYDIADGWYVATHSSTAFKVNMIAKIAKALKVKLTTELC